MRGAPTGAGPRAHYERASMAHAARGRGLARSAPHPLRGAAHVGGAAVLPERLDRHLLSGAGSALQVPVLRMGAPRARDRDVPALPVCWGSARSSSRPGCVTGSRRSCSSSALPACGSRRVSGPCSGAAGPALPPRRIRQFAHSLRDHYRRQEGVARPEAYVSSLCSLNRGPERELIDQQVNLAEVPRSLAPASWITRP